MLLRDLFLHFSIFIEFAFIFEHDIVLFKCRKIRGDYF